VRANLASAAFHLEIGPLKETEYTGISQVTAALAEQMLGDSRRRTGFFFGRTEVAREIVEDLLACRNGDLLEWHLQRSGTRPAPQHLSGPNVAIFPNRKTCRRGFDFECQIVHDLSTFLTPQFHNADTIEFHTSSLLEDLQSNDVTICVSEATREDVARYLGPLAADRVVAVPLAASAAAEEIPRFAGRTAEPYLLALGTIEPRKNISVMLDYLARNRSFLRRMRVVFLGRHGWGENFDALLARYELREAYEKGRIVFPGFVGEAVKATLLQNARLLVYPSLFEGFGLPVLEALAAGVPAVTTRSSSLPEIGGSACYYFDPFDEGNFDRVLARALSDARTRKDELRPQCREQAAKFSWPRSYSTIMMTIEQLLAAAWAA